MENIWIAADSNQTFLLLHQTTARTVNVDIEHARKGRARLVWVAVFLAGVVAELTFLSTNLATSILQTLTFVNAGRLVACSLADMTTRKFLSTNPIAEDFFTIARNTLDVTVASLTHSVGQNHTGRAGAEVTYMIVGDMTARTRNTTRLCAFWRRSSAGSGRVNDVLTASTGDGRVDDVTARNTLTGVAG